MSSLAKDSSTPCLNPLAILKDERFISLWKVMNSKTVSWDEFRLLPMPDGVEPGDAWEVLTALRRSAGKHIGHADVGANYGDMLWYNLPDEDMVLLEKVARRLGPESVIASRLRGRPYFQTCLGAQVQEVLTSAHNDGIACSYEVVRHTLLGRGRPIGLVRQLIAGYRDTLGEVLAAKDAQPKESLTLLYSRMTRYVEDMSASKATWDGRVVKNLSETFCTGSATIAEAVCNSAYFLGATEDFEVVSPYGKLFGSLVRRIYLIRNNAVAASLLPAATIPMHKKHSLEALDKTPWITWYLQESLRLACELESSLVQESQYTQELVSALKDWPALNRRQADTLASLLTNPDVSIDYAGYAEMHRVSYNTARTDLGALVSGGYLYPAPASRKAAFRANPNLEGFLTERIAGRQG